MPEAYIRGISYHLPGRIETNADLAAENPGWDMARLGAKIGIRERHIADETECSSDLAYFAAEKLITELQIDRRSIDFLLFCTQTPDYILPTTACLLQDRLHLTTQCGALDFNLGCSGYVYGLAIARSFINSGLASRVLLLTGETYSKLIHPNDRTVRPIFGDAGTATIIDTDPVGSHIGEFVFGTDGSGHENLIVPAGGFRNPSQPATASSTDESGSSRTRENIFMDGQELFMFTLLRVPRLVKDALKKADLKEEDIDWFVMHQANAFMNQQLCSKMGIASEKAPLSFGNIGNTVSNSIPIALVEAGSSFRPEHKAMLVGFGVGYSWGAGILGWGDTRLVK